MKTKKRNGQRKAAQLSFAAAVRNVKNNLFVFKARGINFDKFQYRGPYDKVRIANWKYQTVGAF
jgi:hypothetical protein